MKTRWSPIRDKKTNKVLTNVEVCRRLHKELDLLRTPNPNLTEKENSERLAAFHQICGGSDGAEQVMSFLKQIVDEPDDTKAQKIIQNYILPMA